MRQTHSTYAQMGVATFAAMCYTTQSTQLKGHRDTMLLRILTALTDPRVVRAMCQYEQGGTYFFDGDNKGDQNA